MSAPLQSKAAAMEAASMGPKSKAGSAGKAAASAAKIPKQWRMKAAAPAAPPPGPSLGIDVGGVLANKYMHGHVPWHSMMDNAFAFTVLWGRQYGFQNIYICSRVNRLPRPGNPHWVNKFLKSVGLCSLNDGGFGVPDENVILCTNTFGADGKGEHLAHYPITEFIDDTIDCLWSVSSDTYRGNCGATMRALFHFDSEAKWMDHSDEWVPAGCSLIKCSDWREIADYFALDLKLWHWVCANGPPFKPISSDFMAKLADAEAAMTQKAATKYLQSSTSGNYKKWSAALKEVAAAAATSSSASGQDTSSSGKSAKKGAAEPAAAKRARAAAPAARPGMPASSSAGPGPSMALDESFDSSTIVIRDDMEESPSEQVNMGDQDTFTDTFTDPGPCLSQNDIKKIKYFLILSFTRVVIFW